MPIEVPPLILSCLKFNSLRVAIGTASLLAATTLSAQPIQKNGFPCVAEVCLGDGLDELRKITTWDRAMSPYGPGGKPQPVGAVAMDTSTVKSLKTTYPNLPMAAAPYVGLKKFDGSALAALASAEVACDFVEIAGVYTSESGHPTTVKMALAAESSTKQRWAVTAIQRSYPTAVSEEQRRALAGQLKERYAAWDTENYRDPPKTALRFSFINAGVPGFALYRIDGRDQADKLMQHAACGGAGKIKL